MSSERANSVGVVSAAPITLKEARRARPAAYETSLISEYTRFLLLLVAVPLAVAFLQTFANHQVGLLSLVATLALIGSLITSRGNQVLRLILLACLTVNVTVLSLHAGKVVGGVDIAGMETWNGVLLFCLITASCFEVIAWVKSVSKPTLIKSGAWGLLAIPALVYIFGLPLLEFTQPFMDADSPKPIVRDPNWNLSNEFTFRAAKFLIFGIFVFLGACMGSFLNVVSNSTPKGEAIAWRDSRCPQCDSKLLRKDNIPFFSYINLGGKCRNCRCQIPLRYLLVECVVACVFGALFLYELVTGGANLPMVNSRHAGVLWIILYPKWQIIGLYFLHVCYMGLTLVLALIEWDRQPLKIGFWLPVSVLFFVTMMIFLPTQPIPLFEHVPQFEVMLSPGLEQLLKLLTGSFLGAAIGTFWNKAILKKPSAKLTLAFLMTGMVLGWQGLVQVTLLFGLFYGALSLLFRNTHLYRKCPTTVLFTTILVHHPFWKMLAAGWGGE